MAARACLPGFPGVNAALARASLSEGTAILFLPASPLPVLVEWDNDVPEWPVLRAEASRAARVLAA